MKRIYILITLDVEPERIENHWDGPEDIELSGRSIEALFRLATDRGYPVSFFIHPEMAHMQRGLFRRLKKEGACLGLHIHATKFQYPLWEYEFGYYSYEEQRRMLADGKEQWAMGLGEEPRYFRPGAFSANDATFRALRDEGFLGAALSVPGRVWPERYSCWEGTEPDPHRAHPNFRLVRGDLDVVNVPLTVDFQSPAEFHGMRYFHDLRPDTPGLDHAAMLNHIVARLLKDKPPVPAIHITTANDKPFWDEESEYTKRLISILDAAETACREAGIEAVPVSLETVCGEVLAAPRRAPRGYRLRHDHDPHSRRASPRDES